MTKLVLIVDDNSTNLYMLESLLKGHGMEVTLAENGRDALDKARLNPPDLIISDILMPVMDGYTLCREWKSDERLKHIPFVFYTATYTEPKDETFALSLGAERFILKPQEPDILMNIIKELFEENYAVKQAGIKPLGEEMEFFRRHNEVLFKKLEKKMVDLESANKELKILEEKYRLSFDNVADVICMIDADLNFLSISPSMERVLGYKPQDFIGRPVTDLVNLLTPESFEQAVADTVLILKGKTITATIYRFIAKDGTIKYGEASGSPIMRDGEIIGMISVVRDITRRKLAEDALREGEEKYRTLIQKIQTAVVVHGPDTRILTCNPKSQELLGLTEDQLIGKTAIDPDWYFFKTDGTVMTVEEYPVNQVITRRQALRNFIVGVHHPNKEQGNEVWVLVNAVPVFVNDEIAQVIVTFIDITELKHAEEALKKSEGKYHGILENIYDAYYELDLEGNLVFFNQALIVKTGYSREELMGMNYKQYMRPDTSKHVSGIFSGIYSTGQPVRLFDYEIITKNGQARQFESWADLLIDDYNQPIGFKGMARDITVRKRAEENLKETLESLRKAFSTTVQVMVSAVETRDPYTAGHQIRSANIARAIATEMGLPQEKIEGIHMAGSIHDIGKLSVPAEMLSKPTKLTNIEFSLVKEHARKGYEMLKDVESPWPLAQIVYQHHERMDGSGYPRNLKGDEILMEARIMAVADVLEAMASHRPYRPGLGIDAALNEIEKNRGIFYDNTVADACLRLFREKGFQMEGT